MGLLHNFNATAPWYGQYSLFFLFTSRPCTLQINAVHIFPLNQPSLLQGFDHPIDRSHADIRILLDGLVIDFLAAAALISQNNIDQYLSLVGDSAAFFLQFLQNAAFLILDRQVFPLLFLVGALPEPFPHPFRAGFPRAPGSYLK